MHSADYRLATAIVDARLDEVQNAAASRLARKAASARDWGGPPHLRERVLHQIGHGLVLLGEGLIRRGLPESAPFEVQVKSRS